MKKTNLCPKCNSSEMVIVSGSNWNERMRIPLSTWKYAAVDRLICASCGFIEEYIKLTPKMKNWLQKKARSSDSGSDFV